ncbi:hypothetical protein A2318_04100 [Candidatus Uhrbacteria bacterium RIFOXYB2_FULL_45_11]|uniref:Anaphase-promoting complex subunit 4 WD40 domain-containing protein n=1 Tax=Candidatus Uhrbacteria bacterium RIFOXYB2_FULL_45_11 TaxID=1802421 RepID=A0A1F7W1W8_9BACT|nr:MAG: hypothetical protein A2318_04100 [Candidatus Uhrbacteria bacterium RIFOXYB2_FULL_45_11]
MTRHFFETVEKTVTHVTLSPSGILLAGIVGSPRPLEYNSIAFWNMHTGELFHRIKWGFRSVGLCWSPIDKHLFEIGEYHNVREIWFEDENLDNERQTEHAREIGGSEQSYLASSPQGEVVQLTSSGVLQFFKQKCTVFLRTQGATCLTFFDRGHYLAIGTKHGEIIYVVRNKDGSWTESSTRIPTGHPIYTISSDNDWTIAVGHEREITILDERSIQKYSVPYKANILTFGARNTLIVGTDHGITTYRYSRDHFAIQTEVVAARTTSITLTPNKRRMITNSTNHEAFAFSPEVYLV